MSVSFNMWRQDATGNFELNEKVYLKGFYIGMPIHFFRGTKRILGIVSDFEPYDGKNFGIIRVTRFDYNEEKHSDVQTWNYELVNKDELLIELKILDHYKHDNKNSNYNKYLKYLWEYYNTDGKVSDDNKLAGMTRSIKGIFSSGCLFKSCSGCECIKYCCGGEKS